jgi:hypothetical protein
MEIQNEITHDEFDLCKLTSDDLSPNEQKAYIDKHWIIINDGRHALLSGGKIELYDIILSFCIAIVICLFIFSVWYINLLLMLVEIVFSKLVVLNSLFR